MEASPYFIDVETKREAEIQILKGKYQPISSVYIQLNKYLNSRSASVQTFNFKNTG